MYRPDHGDIEYPGAARFELRAPFDVLEAILGPRFRESMDKTSTWWLIVHEETGARFLVRDSDHGDVPGEPQARRDPFFVWTVEGEPASTRRFCRWLAGEVQKHVSSRARTLGAASKERVNALLAEGLSLDEALATAAEWVKSQGAERYAWPIQEQ